MSEKKRYLVVVQLKADSVPHRIKWDAPMVLDWLQPFSKGEQEFAFRSYDGLTLGVIIKTRVPQCLHHEFEKHRGTFNGASLMAFEADRP